MKTFYISLLAFFSFFFINAQETWQEATKVADSLSDSFDHNGALLYREKAIELASKQQQDTLEYISFLRKLTQKELAIANPENQKESYNTLIENIEVLKQYGPKPERMYLLYTRIYAYNYIYFGDIKETGKYIQKTLEAHLQCEDVDPEVIVSLKNDSGQISKQLGKLTQSAQLFNEAIAYHKKMGVKDTNVLGRIYSELGDLYDGTHLNNPKKREVYYKKAETIYTSIDNPEANDLIGTFFRMSDFYRIEGDYNNALGYLNKGFKVYNENKEEIEKDKIVDWGVTRELQYYQFLTRVYSKMNDEKKMLEAHEKVVFYGNSKKMDDRGYRWYTISYLDLADYYNKIGDFKKVREYIITGLELVNKKVPDYIPEFNLALAKLEIETNNFETAQVILNNEENFKRIIPSKVPVLLKTKALLNVKINDSNLALQNLNALLNLIDAGDNNITIQSLNSNLYKPGFTINDAHLLETLAKEFKNNNELKPQAKKLYWLALTHFHHNYLQGQLTKELRDNYDKIVAGILNNTEDLSQAEKESFINKTEDIESRFLWSKFNQNRELANNEEIKGLIEREQQVRATITFLKKKNLSKNSEEIKQEIFEETLKLKEIETALNNENSVYAAMVNPSFSVSDLEVNGQSYVKFIVADGSLFRALISDGNISFKNLGDYKAISQDVTTYITSLRDLQQPVASLNAASSALYKTLLEDVSLNTHTYILPQAVLNYLPFELLQKENGYLIEKNTISYAIGLTYLKNTELAAKPKAENSVALFAPSYSKFVPNESQLAVRGEAYDLSGAKAEVTEISKIIPATTYLDAAASKKTFQNLNKDVSIIHLSMHSFLNDSDPELSSLVFSDNEEENELYISELYGLNLNADLAVLSACNTGIGGFNAGDGVVSMSRAFTFAGVPATVSSLWSAPDLSTKKIMVSFYEHLKAGESKSKALQSAKLDYLKNTSEAALKHPYYWAGFVLHGNDAPITLENGMNVTSWLGAIAAAFLIFLIVFLVRKKAKN